MDVREAMRTRHSVRAFLDARLPAEAAEALRQEAEAINRETGLHIQLITDEAEAFAAGILGYGKIKGCSNYLVLAGPKRRDGQIGYYGEKLVLQAQILGLRSCWVALTYRKSKAEGELRPGEKRYVVIALGLGETDGVPHRSRKAEAVSDLKADSPDWFRKGVEAALLAPTAMNQQRFYLERRGEKVKARAGLGPYTKVDLGIVRYHFEIGSGRGQSVWEDSEKGEED